MDDVMTQEHKSKLVLVAGMVAAVCLVSSLLLLLAKLARARRRRARRTQLDLDTVASELELSQVVLQKVPSEFYPKVCNHGEGPY